MQVHEVNDLLREADFLAVRGLLRSDQREWLARALAQTSPDHPWRARL